MHVRCPHCHNPIDVVADTSFTEIACPSCGSSVSLVADNTTSYRAGAKTIAHFEVLERLGIGRFGTVWKARDSKLERVVALKIPRQEQLNADETEQFFREARAAAQLHHPNIVSVHEIGRDENQVYIVSDYVNGANLREWLSSRIMTRTEAADLCARIAEALHHAHEAGVIHRDLKPSNIMMDAQGVPHITDFGLAKRESGEITMTADGKVLGTPAYMSPEQAEGKSHDADRRSDVYSLGVILFELLTGELPFRGEKRMLLLQIINEDPPEPRKLDRRIPRDLETICLKCLRKEPGKRYSTAAQLADDLRRTIHNEPISARPVSRLEKWWLWSKRRPAAVGTIVAAVMLLISLFAVLQYVSHVRRTSVERILAERQANDRKRIESLVDALLSAPADAVQYATQRLELESEKNYAIKLLEVRLRDSPEEVHFNAAVGLTSLGILRPDIQEFVVSTITRNPGLGAHSIVTALRRCLPNVAAAIAQHWEVESDLPSKARLAVVAMHLGEPTLAKEMLTVTSNPIERTVFIDRFPSWHGNLLEIQSALEETEVSAFRSGMCLSLGNVPQAAMTAIEKKTLGSVLAKLYLSASDGSTHSAARWALNQWKYDLPVIVPTANPLEGRKWYVNSIGMTLLEVPGGNYTRRLHVVERLSKKAEIQQRVTITTPFYLACQEVSVEQFEKFKQAVLDGSEEFVVPHWMRPKSAKNEQETTAYYFNKSMAGNQTAPDAPITTVNWFTAVQFCNWLSRREALEPCYEFKGIVQDLDSRKRMHEYGLWGFDIDAGGYRLPTEAEWEYACRANSSTHYCFGDDIHYLDRYSVYLALGGAQPTARGLKMPNGWGFLDMHGNVSEMCYDAYTEYDASAAGELTDPFSVERGFERVLRGGASNAAADQVRSEQRSSLTIDVHHPMIGLRVARNAK